jgi:hypothetical protein
MASTEAPVYAYGAKNDSAVYYFNKGWEYIMDYGQWTLSEEAFRKAVDKDSTFIIGKSLVGKITRDLEERLQLLEELQKEKQLASEDDQLLLEITLKTMELFNARDQGLQLEPAFYEAFTDLGVENYRKFVHKHPNESYMLAEYIEFLSAKHDSQVALDSIQILPSPEQKALPFFISYQAALEADLGRYDTALALARQLDETIPDSHIPAPYYVYAQIYSAMDSLQLAKKYVDKAVQLDSNHMIAKRLQQNLEKKLN